MNAHPPLGQDAVPLNIEAEQAVLGAILLNNQAMGLVLERGLEPDHFHEALHGTIFAEMRRRIAGGGLVTPVVLKDAFPDADLGQFGNRFTVAQYLARLMVEATTVINAPEYADHVRQLAMMRELVWVLRDLAESRAHSVAPDEALNAAFASIDAIRAQAVGRQGGRGALAALVARIRGERQANSEPAAVASTGFTDLDRIMTGGWRARRLYVFAARPGMGKTTLMLSSARRVARSGVGVSIFSLEIDEDEIAARLTADELARTWTPLPYSQILAQTVPADQIQHVERGEVAIEKLPIQIDASSGLSISEIEARARMDRDRFAQHGLRLGLVGIDYLGLVKTTGRYRGNKVDEFGEVALAAKNMAKRLDTAVVLLAQLNRAVEGRDDKRPTMADLRASGEIEEHADVVGLMVREAVYIERSPEFRRSDVDAVDRYEAKKFHMEVILGKNRLGPAHTVDLWCNPALAAVDNWRGPNG